MALAHSPAREPTVRASFSAEALRTDGTERWLLWMTGAIAAALGTVAFLLWGTRSEPYLLDLLAGFCL